MAIMKAGGVPRNPQSVRPRSDQWTLLAGLAVGLTAVAFYLWPQVRGLAANPGSLLEGTSHAAPAPPQLAPGQVSPPPVVMDPKPAPGTTPPPGNVSTPPPVPPKVTLDVISKAVEMYTSMPPGRAAVLMQGIDTETTVKILRQMDAQSAAEVVGAMDPTRGSALMAELLKPPPATTPAQ